MHYWGVWWGEEPFEKYIEKTGRFMSEFGFQGMPSVSSMKKFIPKDEMHLGSEAIKTHQKHPKGAELIQKYMERDFPVPANFEDYVYVSNLLQAYGIGMGIEAHRRAKPYCMGTLYWQYNDCWPVTSWAGIDYYGNWKALHYEVKDLYETVLISPLFSNDTLNVFIVSDSVNAIDANLNMEILDFKGNQILNVQKNIHVAENSSQSIYSQVMNLKEFRKEKCVAKIWIEKEEKCISERIFFFDRPKHLELPDAEVEINIRKSGCNYVLNLKSDFLIKDFYIEAKGTNGFFSENYFDILPGEVKTVVFTPKDEVNVKPDFEYRSLNKIVHAK